MCAYGFTLFTYRADLRKMPGHEADGQALCRAHGTLGAPQRYVSIETIRMSGSPRPDAGMERRVSMNKLILASLATATAFVGGCASTSYDDGGYGYYDRGYYSQNGRYDYNNPDPRHGGYYADNYYRNDKRYRERRLSNNDRVYRGRDGKYYCRRSDGTTGLVIGAAAGGVLGNVIAPGGSETLGTVLGAIGGAIAGREIDRGGDVRCR